MFGHSGRTFSFLREVPQGLTPKTRRLLLIALIVFAVIAIWPSKEPDSQNNSSKNMRKASGGVRPQGDAEVTAQLAPPPPVPTITKIKELAQAPLEMMEPEFPSAKLNVQSETAPWVFPGEEALWVPDPYRLDRIPAKIPYPPLPVDWNPSICFVARTYSAQEPGGDNPNTIDKFIASLYMQTDPSWILVLIDTGPVRPGARRMTYLKEHVTKLKSIDPERITIVDMSDLPPAPPEATYSPVPVTESSGGKNYTNEDADANLFHSHVYWLTDMAIRKFCPRQSKYVVATNGDNYYHPDYVATVKSTAEEHINTQIANDIEPVVPLDVVSVDFYSRHWMINPRSDLRPWTSRGGAGCMRLQTQAPCMRNTNSGGHTDLGSNAIRIESLLAENRFFYNASIGCKFMNAHDGCFAEATKHWKKQRIHSCLFSHAPNPWQCILYDNHSFQVWPKADGFRCYRKEPTPQQFGEETRQWKQEQVPPGTPPWFNGRCYDGEPKS